MALHQSKASVTMMMRGMIRGVSRSTTTHGGSILRPWNTTRKLSFSTKHFSSYEYPLRHEAPIVTRTTAAEAAASQEPSVVDSNNLKTVSTNQDQDRFDDAGTMSDLEAMARRQQQKQWMSTSLEKGQAILHTPPVSIPPNVSGKELAVPTTEISTLANGIRVVSQETYGQVTTVGVLSNIGSRLETPQNRGVTHLLELLAFKSTRLYDSPVEIFQALQDWGGASFCNTSREQTLHCIDVLRPNTAKAMSMLAQVLLEPLYREEEVEDCKRAIEFQTMDVMPEIVLGEALQHAAYGPHQQLGQPHFCPLEALPNLSVDTVRDFSKHITNHPDGLVVAGAGIGHDELRQMAQEHFGHLTASSETTTPAVVKSTYTGGQHFVQHVSPMDNFTRIAIGLELGGWHSDDLVPTCVLQTLLGGGNSFSAGGPGKGMYSRLYRQVLNRFSWAESAEAFTAFHTESGLWGMSASCQGNRVEDLTRVLTEHFVRLAAQPVSQEELSRARNMLKCNVLTQLESRLVLFEDIGRQVLTYGKREGTSEMCDKIDAVTAENLQDLAQRALENSPTIAAVGPENDANIPTGQQVQEWMRM